MEFDLAGTLKATDSVSNQDEEREFNLSETLEATKQEDCNVISLEAYPKESV